MNDITALTATMKAAAEKATEAHERLSAMPSDGLFDASLAENAQLESDITALIAHNDASTPANVRALVEALEKAQQYAKERDEENQGLMLTVGRLRVERETMESRTVTVKLPEVRITIAESKLRNLTYQQLDAYNAGATRAAVKLSQVLVAAGIQVIEGEGQ